MLNVLDLFAGIGGFSLGLERAGDFRTVAFCEYDKKAQKVLRNNWPNVPIYDDVRTLTGEQLKNDGITVDVITGGFPCQDLSFAGRGAGLAGERSGLWFEYLRLIKEIRPTWVIIENVSALRSRGLEVVLGGLAEVGYDAEWNCIPASAVGAPHQRDRIWIVGYPSGEQQHRLLDAGSVAGSRQTPPEGEVHIGNSGCYSDVAHTHSAGFEQGNETLAGELSEQPDSRRVQSSSNVPDTHQPRLERCLQDGIAHSQGWEEPSAGRSSECSPGWRRGRNGEWTSEPEVGRVADGFPGRVDSLKQLGNAVVPQIPELIGRAILSSS